MNTMPRVALIGSRKWTNKSKVKDLIWDLKKRFGNELTINSGGTKQGAEQMIKKYSIELGLDYKEYNPANDTYNLYSALPETYYGKQFHPTQAYHRYQVMIRESDYGIVLIPKDADSNDLKLAKYVINKFKKSNKPVIIFE